MVRFRQGLALTALTLALVAVAFATAARAEEKGTKPKTRTPTGEVTKVGAGSLTVSRQGEGGTSDARAPSPLTPARRWWSRRTRTK